MIFDLPPTVAARRADDFAIRVHPIIQRACARCHNENYSGTFQLVQVKNRKEWTPNVARANLDATLTLIDPDNLPRSELLSRALVPHGSIRRPLFHGANDPDYRRIAAWVQSLRLRTNGPPGASANASEPMETGRFSRPGTDPARFSGPSDAESPEFASDRARPVGSMAAANAPAAMGALPSTPPYDGRPLPPETPNPRIPLPPGQIIPGSGAGTQPYAPPGTEFPVPYMMGGPRPKLEASAPAGAPAAAALPPLPQTDPAGSVTTPSPASVPDATAASDVKKPPKKPIKIDPALLERALMNRNGPQ